MLPRVGTLALLQTAWVVHFKTLAITYPQYGAFYQGTTTAIRASIGQSWVLYVQQIGNLGYFVDNSPYAVIFLWTAGLAFLVGLAWLFGVRRHAAVLAGAILASVGVPMFFLALKASKDGLYWSGRYGLPYSVGVPIIAGIAIARSDSARMVIRSRLVAILAGLFVTAELLVRPGASPLHRRARRGGSVLLRVFSYSWAPAVIGHPSSCSAPLAC